MKKWQGILFGKDIDQMIIKICVISKRKIFNTQMSLNWGRKSIYLGSFEQLWVLFTANIRYDICNMQTIAGFSSYEWKHFE